jgi:hypothetical protein
MSLRDLEFALNISHTFLPPELYKRTASGSAISVFPPETGNQIFDLINCTPA